MNTASQRTLHTIEQIVKSVPVGTNLGLLQLIWALITGAFLPARGAVHMALSLAGFSPAEVGHSWHSLMRSDLRIAQPHTLFSIWVIDDPLYEGVLVLGTNLPTTVSAQTVYQLYIDRWPVEQIPLVSKQLLGCHRQFVFNPISCWRLVELAFLVGNLLTWLAATLPPMPSGYWDRHPKKRPDAYDGSWHVLILQMTCLFPSEFEKSVRLPPICPKELQHIAVAKTVKRRFDSISSPYC